MSMYFVETTQTQWVQAAYISHIVRTGLQAWRDPKKCFRQVFPVCRRRCRAQLKDIPHAE